MWGDSFTSYYSSFTTFGVAAIMYGVLLIIAIILLIALSVPLHQKSTNAICISRRRQEGKTVLVIGGSAGMGIHLATDLAHRGARVIIACPFEEEGTYARKQIIQETGNKNVIFKLLDLASLKSVRDFATDILNTEDRLDILLNNTGVGIPADFLTADYGRFLLTLLLLPLLKKTGKPGESSRIKTTSSSLHKVGKVDIGNLNRTNYCKIIRIYSNSKICLILFANELTKRLKSSNVVINNVDPGAVGTRIYYSVNRVKVTFSELVCLIFFKTPWQGAQTALHVALDKKSGAISGAYFVNCEKENAVKRPYCDKTAKALWEDSVRLVKLTENEVDQCFKSS